MLHDYEHRDADSLSNPVQLSKKTDEKGPCRAALVNSVSLGEGVIGEHKDVVATALRPEQNSHRLEQIAVSQ
jgi:hypothetical protein